jgi:DNA-binding NarL/FixJ family response regulator
MDETGLVDLLEALYALEFDEQAWLAGAVAALSRLCGPEQHYIGFYYDASNVEDFKIWSPCAENAGPEILANFEMFRTLLNPDFVRATFRSLYVGSARRTAGGHLEPLLAERERMGWGDILNINGLDPSGVGCLLTVGGRDPEFALDAHEAGLYRRIAAHLSAAFRCRRKLSALDGRSVSAGAEAIVDTSWNVVHAEGAAQSSTARERIKSAAAAIDRARTKQRRTQGREALDAWHPLTSARWTLVDRFEENGRRYIVARENQVNAAGFDVLTDRERQVAVQAALGLTNKQIAYALGISDATVRVLMARAASRLGVHTRKDLLDHPALASLRSGQD